MKLLINLRKRVETVLFYSVIGIVFSLSYFLVLYWSLSLDSSITMLIETTKDQPLYLWTYILLTVLAVILFGINISTLVYRWRRFGPPSLKTQGGAGLGSFVGFIASSCPICGSTVLAALGVIGGVTAFPLAGLELKALSVLLLIFSLWIMRRDMRKMNCGEISCPTPKNASFKKTERPWLVGLIGLLLVLFFASYQMLRTEPVIARLLQLDKKDEEIYKLFFKVSAKVIPPKGFQSKISLKDAVVKIVNEGIIDEKKFIDMYENRGGLPNELKEVLSNPSNKPILLTKENANYYINLLWPIGLANYMETNKSSPVNSENGKSLFKFASTGGWTLGREKNGGSYFNKFKIVELTSEEERLVVRVAENTYRPCCGNSTFFQDCNHGSALLGLLQLGASQGLTEEELYREALAFNSFWFTQTYIETALYFKLIKNIDWENVDPKVVMSKDFSSSGGWRKNVKAEIAKFSNIIPPAKGGVGCGV